MIRWDKSGKKKIAYPKNGKDEHIDRVNLQITEIKQEMEKYVAELSKSLKI